MPRRNVFGALGENSFVEKWGISGARRKSKIKMQK